MEPIMLSDKEFEDEMLGLRLRASAVLARVKEVVGSGESLPPDLGVQVYDGLIRKSEGAGHRISHFPRGQQLTSLSGTEKRCAAGKLCRRTESALDLTTKRMKRIPATVTDTDLCPDCEHWGRRVIGLLEFDYRRLERSIGERRYVQGDKIKSTPTPPTPLNLGVEALMTATVHLALNIGRVVCERIKLPQKYTRRGGLVEEYTSVVWSTRQAREHYDTLLAVDPTPVSLWVPRGYEMERGDGFITKNLSGVDLVLMAVRLHNEVTGELGVGKGRTRLPMPCPHCGGFTLHREIGDDHLHTVTISCVNCPESRWGEAEYDWLKGMLVEDATTLMRWLLAEAVWQRDTARAAVERVQALVRLAEADPDVAGMPGEVFAKYLGEILEP